MCLPQTSYGILDRRAKLAMAPAKNHGMFIRASESALMLPARDSSDSQTTAGLCQKLSSDHFKKKTSQTK